MSKEGKPTITKKMWHLKPVDKFREIFHNNLF